MKNDRLYVMRHIDDTYYSKYLLRLDRKLKQLFVYVITDNTKLYKHYGIKETFPLDNYSVYEKIQSFECIYGGSCSPTPEGIFTVSSKSYDEYISDYYPKVDRVKFFGYLGIFEDYFIHSDLYAMDVDKEDIAKHNNIEPISKNDTYTSGCIRVSQDNLNWLINNIDIGTLILL